MFGFSKHEKLAKAIDAFIQSWTMAQVLEAKLAGEEPPPFRAATYGIIWGVTDALAQSMKLDMGTTAKGLKLHLANLADAESSFKLIVASPREEALLPWVLLAGRAVTEIARGGDSAQTLLPLATKYRIGVP